MKLWEPAGKRWRMADAGANSEESKMPRPACPAGKQLGQTKAKLSAEHAPRAAIKVIHDGSYMLRKSCPRTRHYRGSCSGAHVH
eukprot:4944766-Amphidinium_carterae.1